MGLYHTKQYTGTIILRGVDSPNVYFSINGIAHLFYVLKANNNYEKLNSLVKVGNKVKIYTYWTPRHQYNVKELFLCDNDDEEYDYTFRGTIKHIVDYDEVPDYHEILFKEKVYENRFYIKNQTINSAIMESMTYDIYCNRLDDNKYEIIELSIVVK